MEIYERQNPKLATMRTKLPEIPEIRVPRSNKLRMPILPDPGKTDDNFAVSEKLDFSVSLGSSIARGQELDNKRVVKSLSIKPEGSGSTSGPALESPKMTPSPREGKGTSPRFGANTSRSRRESRRSSVLKGEEVRQAGINVEPARVKLQRVLNTVKIITGICLALKRYVRACQTTNWSFMEMYLHVKKDLDQLVAFNPHSFARVEPESLKLRKLLYKSGPNRTVQDVKVVVTLIKKLEFGVPRNTCVTCPSSSRKGENPKCIESKSMTSTDVLPLILILALMRGNVSFQDYPSHIQIQLARCMTYQSYEARRVILKQGHRAEAFYILLSGFVIANVEDWSPETGKTFVKTVKEMGPGDTFGETALIEGGRRTASIVCKTNVELLVILKEDFDSIIRAPLVRQIDEHVAFCKTMALFQDFPCEMLAENPSQFFYHYFKKDDVVVKNNKESKYIIVVKAGKCRVIGIIPDSSKPRSRLRSAVSKRDLDSAFPNYDDMQKVTSLKRKPITDADKLKNIICLGLLTGKIDRTRLADHGPDVQTRPKTSMTHDELDKRSKRPALKKSKSFSDFLDAVIQDRKKKVITDEDLYAQVRGNFWASRVKLSSKSKKRVTTPADPKRCESGVSSLRSTSSKFPRRKSTARSSARSSFYDTETFTYAQIAELPAGTVFGLESLVQKPPVTFSLVSDGAECIFISKRLFLNLANIKVLRIVTDMIQTYPTPEFIQEQVRNYRNWNRYKNCLVQGVLNRHK